MATAPTLELVRDLGQQELFTLPVCSIFLSGRTQYQALCMLDRGVHRLQVLVVKRLIGRLQDMDITEPIRPAAKDSRNSSHPEFGTRPGLPKQQVDPRKNYSPPSCVPFCDRFVRVLRAKAFPEINASPDQSKAVCLMFHE